MQDGIIPTPPLSSGPAPAEADTADDEDGVPRFSLAFDADVAVSPRRTLPPRPGEVRPLRLYQAPAADGALTDAWHDIEGIDDRETLRRGA